MSMPGAAATIWLLAALGMATLWAWSRRAGRLAFVDAGWAGMMTLSALFVGSVGEGSPLARLLVALFGSVWGARLCLYLLRRHLAEHDDGRHAALRAAWRGSELRSFAFFQAQGVLVALFSLPFLAAAANPAATPDGWMIAAGIVWAVAVGGEAIADRQLSRFRTTADRGRTCRAGLWSWSRHPNYFFEWVHWFAYVLLAVGSPHGWLAIAGPVLMFAFLVRVTGIPWSEAQALRTRGDDYLHYQREVGAFFPRPPRR
jgi:steroid 5-alpha reductase family enzyme